MAMTLSGTTVTFNDSTTQSTSANPVGVGQTWQDVSASRSVNTAYTNSTGKAIQVSVYAYYGVNQLGELKVDTLSMALAGWSSFAYGYVIGTVTAIVPAGSTYRFDTAGVSVLLKWLELRA
jgi:hypothetical protein